MSTVKKHTRRVNGRTVVVHQHSRQDDGGMSEQDQEKRDRFERRVHRELEAAGKGRKPRNGRSPGEKATRKRGPKPARAKKHIKKALRMWKRHKVKSLCFAGMALGEITAWAAWRGAANARKAVRKLRGGK